MGKNKNNRHQLTSSGIPKIKPIEVTSCEYCPFNQDNEDKCSPRLGGPGDIENPETVHPECPLRGSSVLVRLKK